VSLPAFGAMPRRRVQTVVRHLLAELVDPPQDAARDRGHGPAPPLPGGLRVIEPEVPDIDVRVVASRSRLRLLIGMVRDNRPWRLLFGLTGALAAAFAFSAFWMINPTIWQLSDALGAARLSIAMVGTITAMAVWLIVAHHLWERVSSDAPYEREAVREAAYSYRERERRQQRAHRRSTTSDDTAD
jgi:hypothetical protein